MTTGTSMETGGMAQCRDHVITLAFCPSQVPDFQVGNIVWGEGWAWMGHWSQMIGTSGRLETIGESHSCPGMHTVHVQHAVQMQKIGNPKGDAQGQDTSVRVLARVAL